MNKQKSGKGINWLHYKGLPAFTANPIRGCEHLCTWEMPDKSTAICYAKGMAVRINKANPNLYKSFEDITFHPNELKAISRKKKPSNIFIDSMSDLLGTNVPNEQVMEVIVTMRECPQHNFFLLTKNPSGLLKYGAFMPSNVWVGVSSPPSSMFGNVMNSTQTEHWWVSALKAVTQNRHISWVSLEPLSWTLPQAHAMVEILDEHAHKLTWAVIGAASNGNKKYQPDKQVFQMVVDCLRKNNVPIHLKNNLDVDLANEVCGAYLAEYPTKDAIADATREFGGLISPTPLLCYNLLGKTCLDSIIPLGTPPLGIEIPEFNITDIISQSMGLPPRLFEYGLPVDLPQSGVVDWEDIQATDDELVDPTETDKKQAIHDYFDKLRNRPISDGGKMHVDYFDPHKGKRGDIIDAPNIEDNDDDDA